MNQWCMISFLLLRTAIPGGEDSVTRLQTSFMVISDTHCYDPALGIHGDAFEIDQQYSGKLIRESTELIEEAIKSILGSGVEMVVIPGDLTRDGALQSHLRFAAYLESLENQGIKVFVVPGNHDVNNKRASAYQGDSMLKAARVGAGEFAEIYGAFGYEEALFRDSSSLSYIAEPLKDLWLIGLDACVYPEDPMNGYASTGGEIRKETLRWLERHLLAEEAARKMKIVIMHHGVLEHFQTQARYFEDYLVNRYKKTSRWLAGMGVKTVFTGHFHANDITLQRWKDGAFLFDIETGSLHSYPCPLRKIAIAGDSMIIETHHLQTIPSLKDNLQEHARELVVEGAAHIADKTMTRYGLNKEDASYIANQMGNLLAGHCAGDEIASFPPLDLHGVSLWGRIMVYFRRNLARGLVTDLPPGDNQLTIHLQTGKYH